MAAETISPRAAAGAFPDSYEAGMPYRVAELVLATEI